MALNSIDTVYIFYVHKFLLEIQINSKALHSNKVQTIPD